ncbi:MAG: type I-F CRISPR-associated protein Csy2 [Desulfamplus sp.]|nr:type I-F CRISPR-associated protein Csy2 [Desulfamplus sp.]
MRQILLIPHIKVHNANAQSSPYTIGFPAMTAWLGAVHALQRKLNQKGVDKALFKGVGVVCHEINLARYKGEGDFYYSIIGTRNPLKEDGKSPSFIEEARCDFDVSLTVEYQGVEQDQESEFAAQITKELYSGMKIASGDIVNFGKIESMKIIQEQDFKRLRRQLMPGYLIRERRDLMVQAMKEEGKDAIDALLDYLKIMHRSEKDENGKITWTSKRKESGWIVPIATGFHGLTELGKAKNQRDPETLHRFAESVVTLGEFIMPYRINSLDEMLWHYHTDLENNLYLCQQN